MARVATKASGNVYYQARMEASKVNEKLRSRAGAAELLNMSEDAVKDVELGLNKCTPVDTVVRMADLYGAPQLLYHYCLHECPIGKNLAISEEVKSIERVTVQIIDFLNADNLNDLSDRLIRIAVDGEIDDEEAEQLKELVDRWDELERSLSELKTASKLALAKRRMK